MRFLHVAEYCDSVSVNIVMWIKDTGDGWGPCVGCLVLLVIIGLEMAFGYVLRPSR